MAKVILLALILESIAIPIFFAESRTPRRAIRYVQWSTLLFICIWAYLCITWYPQLVPLD